jgi:hypothetical protein
MKWSIQFARWFNFCCNWLVRFYPWRDWYLVFSVSMLLSTKVIIIFSLSFPVKLLFDIFYIEVWNLCRFRLKINVRDEVNEVKLVLFDEQVKRLAFETCAVLVSIVYFLFPVFYSKANWLFNCFCFKSFICLNVCFCL